MTRGAIGSTITVRCGRGGLAGEEGGESGPTRHRVVRDRSDVRVGGRTWGVGSRARCDRRRRSAQERGKTGEKIQRQLSYSSRQLATARLQLDYSFDSSRRF